MILLAIGAFPRAFLSHLGLAAGIIYTPATAGRVDPRFNTVEAHYQHRVTISVNLLGSQFSDPMAKTAEAAF